MPAVAPQTADANVLFSILDIHGCSSEPTPVLQPQGLSGSRLFVLERVVSFPERSAFSCWLHLCWQEEGVNFSWFGGEEGKGCAAVPGFRPSGVSACPR